MSSIEEAPAVDDVAIQEKESAELNYASLKIPLKEPGAASLTIPGDDSNSQDGQQRSKSFLMMATSTIFTNTQQIFQASKNSKFAKKVFRSNDAIEEEQKRQHEISNYVIHPFSPFRWYWDMIMVVILIFTLIMLPYVIAFDLEQLADAWSIINLIIDTIFLIDMCLNFKTGFIKAATEEVILDPKEIAITYAKTWFIVDLVSSIPFDQIYVWSSGEAEHSLATLNFLKALRLTKLLSLLKVFRMARLLRYIYKLEEILDIDASVIRIFNLIMMVLVMSHWNGCMQYFIIYINDFPSDSWVVMNGLHTSDVPSVNKYAFALFKAMSHMLSIGYGQSPPVNILEVWLTIISMMMGATFYALFIGNMSSLLLSLDASGRLYQEKVSQAKEYMRYKRVPFHLQKRVHDYYEHKYQRKYFDEDLLLHEPHMSLELRKDILLHNCKSLVEKVDFLSQGSTDFVCDVIMKMQFEVVLPGDRIIQAGKKGDCMYFIEHGKVEIVLPNGEVVNRLGDGQHFGEISLLMDERRVASVIALEICDLYKLSRENFASVLAEYPQMLKRMEITAKERLASIRADYPKLYDSFKDRFQTTK